MVLYIKQLPYRRQKGISGDKTSGIFRWNNGYPWPYTIYPEGANPCPLDRYCRGSTGTRVFSIVESPNILGSIFILIIPLCLGLVLQKKRKFNDRALFFVLLGAMGLSLVLTLSRGAWLGQQ